MVEREIDFVKVQPRKAGNFMVTIPQEAVRALGLRKNVKVKVLLDADRKRVVYQF